MNGRKKRELLIHLIGFVVARAVFFDMNPLAIGFFTASYLGKTNGGLAFAAAFLGIASSMNVEGIMKYALALIAALILMEVPLVKKQKLSNTVQYILPAFVLGIFSILEVKPGETMSSYAVMAILEGIIVVVSAVMFKHGIDYLMRSQVNHRMNNEQMVSMAVIVAVIIYGIPNYTSEYLAPVETVVYFIILFFMYKYGAGQGTITGAVCGFALSLRGGSLADAGALTMMGIIPSIFRDMGRFPTAVIYCITAFLLGFMNEGMELTVRQIGAITSAVMIFLLLPGSWIYRVDATGHSEKPERFVFPNMKKLAKIRMNTFADSFLKLSKTLDIISEKQIKLRQKDINLIFEDISEKLCKNCTHCGQCWEQKFTQTYQAACKMFEIAETKGIVQREDIPNDFLDDCISIDDFIAETNRGFEIAKLNQIWQSRVTESRKVIAEQLREVSEVIQEITGDVYETVEASHLEEQQVIRRLKMEHVNTRDITILVREDKRKEIYLNAACRGGRCITAKEAALLISDAIGIRVRVSEASKSVITKNYDNFIFVEDTKFRVLTGVARAMKESVSGDNFSVLKLETGDLMIAISDGMGTGKEAGEESETVMALLEQMIEAGFKAETAIKLINSSLVLKSEKQTFSTIDMSIINQFSGMCEFVKIGAAASFIKRGNVVETIHSTTLPIGMFGNVDFDSVSKRLYEGDILIMVTDGVLDCLEGENKEELLEKLILEVKSNNPQEIANRILEKSLAQRNYLPMDDMTVITAGVWLK